MDDRGVNTGDDLDELIDSVMYVEIYLTSALYQCRLWKLYISRFAEIVQPPAFQSCAVKIQKAREEELTENKYFVSMFAENGNTSGTW